MTNIEQKALALVREVLAERNLSDKRAVRREVSPYTEALCRAIEQHEAFRQEVSDAVVEYFGPKHLDVILAGHLLSRFIIPAPKPDPLVEIIGELDDGTWGETKAEYADRFRAALDAAGFEIREKNDGQPNSN